MKTNVMKMTLAVLATSWLLTACQKSGSDSAPVTPVNPYGYCQGCSGFSQSMIFQAPAQGTGSFPVTFAIQMMGDANIIAQTQASGYSPGRMYTGPAFLTGTMSVAAQTFAGYCMIPAGNYQLNTLQVGQMQAGQFSIQQIEAVGPVRFVIAFSPGQVLDPDVNGVIDRVGGQLYFLQGPTQYYGGMSSCNDSQGVFLN